MRRRRRLALALLLGAGPRRLRDRRRARRRRGAHGARPQAARSRGTLPPPQLAGERIVAGFAGTAVPPALRRAIRRGEVAGVVLFAGNLPSRAAGRRLIASLQAIPRPPALRDAAAGDGRPGGRPGEAGRRRPDRLGGGRWAPAAPPSAANRAAAPRPTCATSASTSTWRRCSTSPAPAATIAATERGFGASAAASRRDRGPVRRKRCRRAAWRRPPSTSPASARRPKTPTSRCSGSASRRQRCGAVDEAPYRAFVAAGGELVMLSTAIYPAFSSRPAAFARPIATGELRGRLGFEGVSITDALDTVAVRGFGGPAQGRARRGPGRRRPAALHRPRRRRSRRAGRWSRSCAPAPSTASEFEAVGRSACCDLRVSAWRATV